MGKRATVGEREGRKTRRSSQRRRAEEEKRGDGKRGKACGGG